MRRLTEKQKALASQYVLYALHCAKKYLRMYADGTIVEDALYGLCRAAAYFDDSRNIQFTTYATHAINSTILNGIHKFSRFRGYRKNSKHRKTVISLDEIVEKTQYLQPFKKGPDRFVDGAVNRLTVMVDWQAGASIDQIDTCDAVRVLMASLTDEQRDIVTRYWFKGETHATIAKSYGLTRTAISIRIASILRKLRKHPECQRMLGAS